MPISQLKQRFWCLTLFQSGKKNERTYLHCIWLWLFLQMRGMFLYLVGRHLSKLGELGSPEQCMKFQKLYPRKVDVNVSSHSVSLSQGLSSTWNVLDFDSNASNGKGFKAKGLNFQAFFTNFHFFPVALYSPCESFFNPLNRVCMLDASDWRT